MEENNLIVANALTQMRLAFINIGFNEEDALRLTEIHYEMLREGNL
ncbi:MAG: hypothetical protein GQ570_08525 [Helicobacteraceae bacterium]|nr:hypothetical protein [Helicobacteraceae bacterium]